MEYLVIFACIIFLFVLFKSIVVDKQKDAEQFWDVLEWEFRVVNKRLTNHKLIDKKATVPLRYAKAQPF